jgi:ATP-binding cassette, subfamily F, member 3
MIRFLDLTLSRGGRDLLRRVTLTINPGRRVGIIGPNGIGKSTLFAAIKGELASDNGSIDFPARWVLAHVAQDTPTSPLTALEFTLAGDRELLELEKQIEEMNAAEELDGHALAEAYAHLDLIDGHSARARAGMLLAGLGFPTAEQSKVVSSFSGGWRMRLNLAQALMCRSDLLLLDEPTNHLDLNAMIWLESWLKRYQGTVLIITHDRDFLDQVAQDIVALGNTTAVIYTGNYTSYETQRAEQLMLQSAQFSSQQKKVAHLESFINRFKAKASKAKQAQSRIKALEKMEMVAEVQQDNPFSFSFFKPQGEPRQLLRLEEASLGYNGNTLLSGINLDVDPEARIGLLGINGAGKSTLVKALANTLALQHGQRIEGKHLRLGYFAQHQIDQLDLNASALLQLSRLDAEMGLNTREQSLRGYLGGFDFHGDRVNEPVAPFSGGEKARLALALIVYQRPNCLLLDEPTNHLDMMMRDALARALQSYEGAMILVAHDRHLLRASCDEFWCVGQGVVARFEGDLEDYQTAVNQQQNASTKPAAVTKPAKPVNKPDDSAERNRLSQLRKPIEKKISQIEKQIATSEQALAVFTAWFAVPDRYSSTNPVELKRKTTEQTALQQAHDKLESQWLEAQAELEWVR